MSLYLDRAIVSGLLGIIVLTALLHGAVEPWSVLLMELLISILILLWGIKAFVDRGLKLALPAVIWPIVTLTALGVVQSIAFTDKEGIWRSLSFDAEATRGTVIALVFLILFCLLSASSLTSGPRLQLLARFLAIYGLVMAFIGVLQYFTEGHTLNWWRSVEGESFGSFVNRNHFAGYMELLFPWPVMLLFARRGHIGEQIFYGFAAVWIGAASTLTLSRGGMISIFSELMLLGILSRYLARDDSNQSKLKQASTQVPTKSGETVAARLVRPGLMAAIALAIILGVFWLGAEPVINRITTGNAAGAASPLPANGQSTSRLATWQDTWKLIRANPIFGAGLGAYETAYPIYANDNGLAGVVAQAHNDYLQVLADGGIIGGIILLWFIVIIGKAVRRGLKTQADPFLTKVTVASGVAIFGILVHSLFDFNLQLPSHALLFGLFSVAVSQINTPGFEPVTILAMKHSELYVLGEKFGAKRQRL